MRINTNSNAVDANSLNIKKGSNSTTAQSNAAKPEKIETGSVYKDPVSGLEIMVTNSPNPGTPNGPISFNGSPMTPVEPPSRDLTGNYGKPIVMPQDPACRGGSSK